MMWSSTGAADSNYAEEASYCTDTCSVVIFGEAGAGKSSLVNLITKSNRAPTSCDTMGCTAETTMYEHEVLVKNQTLKVKLFDTPGLNEGSEGRVPDDEARKVLKHLLRKLKEQEDIHLLMYCVHYTKAVKALCRNYKLCSSEVSTRCPIVLVITGLEDKKPEMEEWWRNNEQSISQLNMTFAGHACVTALDIDEYATERLKLRHEQSHYAICKLIEECRARNKAKNIVIFGETGAGKSSLVNLMAGKEVAITSPDTQRCTMHWQEYTIDFHGEPYKVFDTVGLEETQLGIKEYLESVDNAYKLIKKLDAEGGVDLLLFCIRAGRLNTTIQSNYRLFHEFLCEKKVPIVLVITHLEREARMEDWWDRQQSTFEKTYGIRVADHACITAANRLDGRHKDRYEESRVTVRTLVEKFTVDDQKSLWAGGNSRFVSFMRKLKGFLPEPLDVKKKDIVSRLMQRCNLSPDVAKQLAQMIKQV
ncbi:P-loop containing nucleoside triphosphate hydrolase protein [Suillus discolor]|uniref:P-loop containing nucleoside triphosphate hydrolase protein n=1 Tax=Suillus discolor TaxID=1912936 RepID=A0A9P7JS99_9AGAM|nr:P-loop containing nucleoside triphosphate hydrolase protein [Suillus discolor]KAG2104401.1 P-loop containing nucleoside triphosphate hydrolase protein [Suillus discolor]